MKKNRRIQIRNLDEYNQAISKTATKTRTIEQHVLNELYDTLSREQVVFRVNHIEELVDYIEQQLLFEKLHAQLQEKLKQVQTLIIDRIEYEREQPEQEDVTELERIATRVANQVSKVATEEEYNVLQEVEQQIQEEQLFAKDVELLKKIVLATAEEVKETYDTHTKVNTIEITMPETLSKHYMKAQYGSVEYYQQICKDTIRLQRLLKHLKEESVIRIDQSKALQDSINIAVAVYNNQVYKAISGHDEIKEFHKAPSSEEAAFTSRNVNRHGKLGLGYDRSNDSEKKLFEIIHKQIQANKLESEGVLTLYSKWEPCPSCYLVMHQFREMYPNILIEVRYQKGYGLV